MPAGSVIPASALVLVDAPKDDVSVDTLRSVESIAGNKAKYGLVAGQLLEEHEVVTTAHPIPSPFADYVRSKLGPPSGEEGALKRREDELLEKIEPSQNLVYSIKAIHSGETVPQTSISTIRWRGGSPKGGIFVWTEVVGHKAKYDIRPFQIISKRDLL